MTHDFVAVSPTRRGGDLFYRRVVGKLSGAAAAGAMFVGLAGEGHRHPQHWVTLGLPSFNQ